MDDKNEIIVFERPILKNLMDDGLLQHLISGFNNFLILIDYGKGRKDLVSRISWYYIFVLINYRFTDLWEYFVEPKYLKELKELDEYGTIVKSETIRLIQKSVYIDIIQIIKEKELFKDNNDKKSNKILAQEISDKLYYHYQTFYYLKAASDHNIKEIKKLADKWKKFNKKRTYNPKDVTHYENVLKIYSKEQKEKKNPRSLRSIAMDYARKEKILIHKVEQESFYKDVNRYKNNLKRKRKKK